MSMIDKNDSREHKICELLSAAKGEDDIQFLEKVLSESPEDHDDFEILDIPKNLNMKLYEISDEKKSRKIGRWISLSTAAGLLALGLFIFDEKRNEVRKVEQAKNDLVITLAYLNKLSSKGQKKFHETLNSNINEPVVKGMFYPVLKEQKSIRGQENG